MKLSKFYTLLSAYAGISIERKGETIYNGTVKNIPDEFDDLTVLDFDCIDTAQESVYNFYVK